MEVKRCGHGQVEVWGCFRCGGGDWGHALKELLKHECEDEEKSLQGNVSLKDSLERFRVYWVQIQIIHNKYYI